MGKALLTVLLTVGLQLGGSLFIVMVPLPGLWGLVGSFVLVLGWCLYGAPRAVEELFGDGH